MPGIVPLRRSAIQRPLPSTGSLRVGSPASPVLRDAPIPCRPSRRTSLPSLGGTELRSLVRSRRRPNATAAGQGLWINRLAPRSGLVRRRQGLPGSWGTPCVHALLSDPGGTSAPGHLGASVLPSAIFTTSAPTITPYEAQSHGLHTRCLRSVATVTRSHVRLASGCWPALPGGTVYPLGSIARFRSAYISSSLPRLHLAHKYRGGVVRSGPMTVGARSCAGRSSSSCSPLPGTPDNS